MAGLMKYCPLLKALLEDCIRLHCPHLSLAWADRDFTVALAKATHDFPKYQTSLAVGARTYVAIAPFWARKDGISTHENWEAVTPEGWHCQMSDSHEENIDKMGPEAEDANLISFAGNINVEKEVLAFVAGIMALWDISPLPPKHWLEAKQKFSSLIAHPVPDIRVLVSSREL